MTVPGFHAAREPLRAIGVAVLLGIVGWFVGTAATFLAVGHLSLFGFDNRTMTELGTSVAFNVVGAAGLSMTYLVFRYGGFDRGAVRSFLRVRKPTVRDAGWVLAGVVGAFVVVAGVTEMMELLDPFGTGGEGETHSGIEAGREYPALLLVGVPIALVLTGPGEELLFRGVIQSRLAETFPTVIAVVLASLVFGLVHVPVYMGDDLGPTLVSLGTVTVLGFYLGALYELSGNLLVPAIVHGGFNAVVSLSNYLAL